MGVSVVVGVSVTMVTKFYYYEVVNLITFYG